MSLLSHLILPAIEQELANHSPEIQAFIVTELHALATDVIVWAQDKMHDKTKDNQHAAS